MWPVATVLNSTVLDDFFFDTLSRLPISRFSPVYTSSSVVNSQKFPLVFSKAVHLSFGQYYMVNIMLCCQVQWSLQCIHHVLLCVTLDTVPHCSLLLSLWRWGLPMVECSRAEGLQGLVLEPFLFTFSPQDIKHPFVREKYPYQEIPSTWGL